MKYISSSLRQKFIAGAQNGLLKYGSAVTVDEVHLKVQSKHFYDFTLHFVRLQRKGPFQDVSFEVRTVTLLLVQGPDEPSAKNIRACPGNALIAKYEISLESLTKDFIMVMGSAAVMVRVANASVSREIHKPDETWMSCAAHFLNNNMKAVLANTEELSVL